MKQRYVRLARALRCLLAALGLLALLDRWAARSRFGLWVRSLLSIYDLDDLVGLGVPWWTFASADRVEEFLRARPGARVLEWGSGSSTLWLADRPAEVVSVEHDVEWGHSMGPRLPANARLVVVPPEEAGPGAITSAKAGFEGLDFTDYVQAPERFPGPYDVVVIDGRAREACLEVALRRVAPDGLIVFDNVDRERYRDALTAQDGRVSVEWTRGLTPSLPYPTRTALVRPTPTGVR